MSQTPRELSPNESPRHFFGAELRYWRELRNLSQDELGRRVHISGDALSKIEKALRWPPAGLADACDDVLATGGVLARLWPLVNAQHHEPSREVENRLAAACGTSPASLPAGRMVLRVDQEGNVWAEINRRVFLMGSAATLLQSTQPPLAANVANQHTIGSADDYYGFARTVSTTWSDLRLSRPAPDYAVDWNLLLPGGRAMSGAGAAVQLCPARVDGERAVLTIPEPRRTSEFVNLPGRGLLLGATSGGEHPRFYALEARDARRQLQQSAHATEVRVPAAYELDDLTYGILWALANLDDALQSDDQPLDEFYTDLKAYERLPSSAVSREAAPGLNPIAQMWLGSEFCAGHISRALPQRPETPAFWTREQRGEEASTWLLFAHKYRYLRQCAEAVGEATIRGFCVPEYIVRASPLHERVLMFLAIALMESLDIHVQLSDDPIYENVEGFALAPRKQAVIANWVRSDGMWHVDTARMPAVREFSEIISDVSTNSVIEACSPRGRIRALAEYLALPWPWLHSRCSVLGRHGTSGFAQPRSRLISTAGLDAACAFVGSLPADI